MLPRVEEITKELDKQPQHSGHSAAAFIRSAKHRLTAVVPAASPAAHSAPFGSPAVSPSATALGDFVAEGFNPELTSQKEKSPQKQENFNV